MTDDDMDARFRMYSERFKQASVAGEVYFDTLEYIIRLRKERDYARREVCWIFTERSDEPTRIKAQSFATDRGWDCFKEDSNDR